MDSQKTFFAIGVMSGSSLDGLDVVYCIFSKGINWDFEILEHQVYSISEWEKQLKNSRSISENKLNKLDKQFGKFIGKMLLEFINEKNISELDIIVSHGHTVFHFPEKGITKQIGNGQEIFNKTQKTCLYNLRQKDIELGGNGAPIVPIGDLHLFSNFKYCLNIGGIANISIKTDNGINAFDICSANQVLNYYALELGKKYDDKGKIARKGNFNQSLFDALNNQSFYKINGPKSLDNGFTQEILDIINAFEIEKEDKLNTFCHHIAFQIANSLKEHSNKNEEKNEMLISGGGAYNEFLVELIQRYNSSLKIVIPSNEIIEYKEALVMAFMGVLYLKQEVNCLASVTGASKDSICGEFIN